VAYICVTPVFLMYVAVAVVVGWQIRYSATDGATPAKQAASWIVYGFGLIGWCVWGPCLALAFGRGREMFFYPVVGLTAGLLVGWLTARIVVPFFYPDDETDHGDEVIDDGRD
jgi:hypothetical protein